MKRNLISIYGLKLGMKFIYVGQTFDVTRRMSGHRHPSTSIGKLGITDQLTPVLLRKTHPDKACKIEGQIIRALKKRGECEFNRTIPKDRPRVPRAGRMVHHFPSGKTFLSLSDASRFLKISTSTICNYIRDGDPELRFIQK